MLIKQYFHSYNLSNLLQKEKNKQTENKLNWLKKSKKNIKNYLEEEISMLSYFQGLKGKPRS